MKRAAPALVGLALLAGSAWAQPAPPLAPLLHADGSLSSSWRFVGFPKKQAAIPAAVFEAGKADQQAGLKVGTNVSYGTWVQPWKGVPPGQLQWQWRLDEPLNGGQRKADLLAKGGDDAALKICVMFDHPLDSVPFMERTVLRIARSATGENLPAATVCYVWDSAGPAPREGVNPYTRRVRFISLQGKQSPLKRWASESRDVMQDFATLFADELSQGAQTPRTALPAVTTVLIGADSDNTGSKSTGWVADLRWAP